MAEGWQSGCWKILREHPQLGEGARSKERIGNHTKRRQSDERKTEGYKQRRTVEAEGRNHTTAFCGGRS